MSPVTGEGGAPRGLADRWRAIVALGLLGLLAGGAWGIADQPSYAATASVVTSPGSGPADAADLDRLAGIGMSRKVADAAATILGDDVPGADLLSVVSVTPATDGVTLIVTATSGQPDVAAAAADGYAQALVQVEGGGSGTGDERLVLGAPASLPSDPVENRPGLLWAGLGLLAGLALGLLTALLLGRRREVEAEPSGDAGAGAMAPRDEEELGAPLLATVAEPAAALQQEGPGLIRLRSTMIGAFRELVDRLALDGPDAPPTLAVLPHRSGLDAGSVALALAAAAAEVGTRVILLEADPGDPVLASSAAVAGEPGLADYLRGAAEPRDVLRSVGIEAGAGEPFAMAAVPAGAAGAPASLPRLEALLRRLPRVYDLVVLQVPPGNAGLAPALLAEAVVVVAADGGSSGLGELTEALDPGQLLGVVVRAA